MRGEKPCTILNKRIALELLPPNLIGIHDTRISVTLSPSLPPLVSLLPCSPLLSSTRAEFVKSMLTGKKFERVGTRVSVAAEVPAVVSCPETNRTGTVPQRMPGNHPADSVRVDEETDDVKMEAELAWPSMLSQILSTFSSGLLPMTGYESCACPRRCMTVLPRRRLPSPMPVVGSISESSSSIFLYDAFADEIL